MTAATLELASYNTAIGVTALDALTEGDLNVAVGYDALTANTTGVGNTAIGYEALKVNSIASYNVAFGNKAGNTIDNGSSNVVIGGDADVDDADAINRIVIGKGTIGLDNHTVTLGNGLITNWLPTDDGEVSLGKASLEFEDAYFDGTVTSDAFAGPLTGNVTGDVSGSAATVTGAAQVAITSLGSLTALDINGATTINDNLSLDGNKKELRFYEGANYVGFKAPDLAADKIWVLPIEDGSPNQVLKTDGSGNLGWVDGPATYSVNSYYADLGGYVIEVRDGGKHGLVVAMQNQGLSNWYGTNELLNDPANHDDNGDKFMDWRLPTKRELNLIYVNYNSGGNGASLGGDSYYTSTLQDDNQYWYQFFHNGVQAYVGKPTPSYVRAVRDF